jgi:pimeloyl-ACP methyl ester carboxylesterase
MRLQHWLFVGGTVAARHGPGRQPADRFGGMLVILSRVVPVSWAGESWPEKWDGEGDDFTVQQHTRDVASFIAALQAGPVHLLGHSRGGHIASGRRRIILI